MGCFRGASTRLFDRGSSSGSLSGYQKHSDASGLGGSGSWVDPVRALAGELGLGYAALRRSAVPPPNIQRTARLVGVDASVLRKSQERARP